MSETRVLVVDDDRSVLEGFSRGLKLYGYEISSTIDAREAVQWIREGKEFDVIISDMQMPFMNGTEFFSEVIKIHPQYAKRFLFISGSSGPFPEGVKRLSKPVHMKEVVELIELLAKG